MPFTAGAILSGANQVPAPIDTNTTGVLVVVIGQQSLGFSFIMRDCVEVTMSHLHAGNSSVNGPPFV